MSTNLFIELLKVALGAREKLSRVPSAAEWSALLAESQRQAILGVMLCGLEILPNDQLPKQDILLQWIGLSQTNEMTYHIHTERVKGLSNLFKKGGFNSCLLKGIGIAQLYPTPSRRQCGDIDLWLFGKMKEILQYLRKEHVVEHVFWHHADVIIYNDVNTEIHYRPSWMYNPFSNNKLQKWFEQHTEEQIANHTDIGYTFPTVRFNAVYSLVHFYHHLIDEGIGVRHVIDYFYILKALPKESRSSVVSDLKNLGLFKLTGAVMWVLEEVCGMSAEYSICEPDEKEGRFLFDEMMRGGNFGHYRKDNRKRNTAGRMFALLPHYPREVLWVVPWKLWHRCWRKKQKN